MKSKTFNHNFKKGFNKNTWAKNPNFSHEKKKSFQIITVLIVPGIISLASGHCSYTNSRETSKQASLHEVTSDDHYTSAGH